MTGLEAAVAIAVALIAGGPAWRNGRRAKGAHANLEARLVTLEAGQTEMKTLLETNTAAVQSLTAAVQAVNARQDAHEAASRPPLRIVRRRAVEEA